MLKLDDKENDYGNVPNEYGIYEDELIKTLEEQYSVQDVWFQKPDQLFPFIFFVDKKPAGFALVATGGYAPKRVTVEWQKDMPSFYEFAITLDGLQIGAVSILLNESEIEGEIG